MRPSLPPFPNLEEPSKSSSGSSIVSLSKTFINRLTSSKFSLSERGRKNKNRISIFNLPTEIILHILSFTQTSADLLALTSSCKRFYSVYTEYPHILQYPTTEFLKSTKIFKIAFIYYKNCISPPLHPQTSKKLLEENQSIFLETYNNLNNEDQENEWKKKYTFDQNYNSLINSRLSYRGTTLFWRDMMWLLFGGSYDFNTLLQRIDCYIFEEHLDDKDLDDQEAIIENTRWALFGTESNDDLVKEQKLLKEKEKRSIEEYMKTEEYHKLASDAVKTLLPLVEKFMTNFIPAGSIGISKLEALRKVINKSYIMQLLVLVWIMFKLEQKREYLSNYMTVVNGTQIHKNCYLPVNYTSYDGKPWDFEGFKWVEMLRYNSNDHCFDHLTNMIAEDGVANRLTRRKYKKKMDPITQHQGGLLYTYLRRFLMREFGDPKELPD